MPINLNGIDYSQPLYKANNGFSNLYGLLGDNNQINQEVQGDIFNSLGLNKDNLSWLQNNPQAFNYAVDRGLVQLGTDSLGNQTITSNLNDGMFNNFQNDFVSSSKGLFSQGQDKFGNVTYGGANGLQWLGAGLGTVTSLYGMYNAHKSMKLARENFEDQKRLQQANYGMQAKAYNNNLRNQQSGRSFTGMSGTAMRTLGREYDTRKARDTY